uniref:Uncharacterized protein n=1 Tax=Hordeum vulgare subsp. vulgare TaxID=112509 RepID=A0A8I6WT54_HORVV
MEGVEDKLKRLNLSKAERKGLKIGWRRVAEKNDSVAKAMGKLFSDRPGYVDGMVVALGKLWCPMRRLEVKEMGENRFLFFVSSGRGKEEGAREWPMDFWQGLASHGRL